MRSTLAAIATLIVSSSLLAQVVAVPAAKTLTCAKSEVTMLAIAPKGDRILVGTSFGAELRDIDTGKRVAQFNYSESGSSTVYYCAFNPNGEYVVLIGFSGKREVWNVKTGKQDKDLAVHKWIPDAIRTRDLGLKMSNSDFDRFYQQAEADHGDHSATAGKDGCVVFTDSDGTVLQTLEFPGNKDQHHRSPCLFHEDWFITGTDDGHVLFYTLLKS